MSSEEGLSILKKWHTASTSLELNATTPGASGIRSGSVKITGLSDSTLLLWGESIGEQSIGIFGARYDSIAPADPLSATSSMVLQIKCLDDKHFVLIEKLLATKDA